MKTDKFSEEDVVTLAQTMYGEARGEFNKINGGIVSLLSVANVIYNRHCESGKSIAEVCKEPKQFSCWNVNDPNRKLIEMVPSRPDNIYNLCLSLAEKVVSGEAIDCTRGANHYHADSISVPYWARGRKPTFKIGSHIFYKLTR